MRHLLTLFAASMSVFADLFFALAMIMAGVVAVALSPDQAEIIAMAQQLGFTSVVVLFVFSGAMWLAGWIVRYAYGRLRPTASKLP